MAILQNKIDFAAVILVKNANPNGDPLNGNRPRVNYDGTGELSDVCIKRKIRNRLMDMEYDVFVQSDDNRKDEYPSLRKRAEGEIPATIRKNQDEYAKAACEKWIDVRAFGQVFAYSGDGDKGISIGIRGPVSIHPAFSINTVNVSSIQITKSVSGEGDGTKRASDTMGMKHRVDFGVYTTFGSINPQLAEKTGFSAEDVEAVKQALSTLFENDASSARPEGSMEIFRLYWWEHNCKSGQFSSAKVHRSLNIEPKCDTPRSIEDYDISLDNLEGLSCISIEGR